MIKPKSSDAVLKNPQTFLAHEKMVWSELSATWKGLPDSILLIAIEAGGWCIKDVMNHTATWQEAAIRVVGDLLAGRFARLGPNPQNFNEINFELDRHKSLALTRKRLTQSRRDLLKLLATVPATKLNNEFGRQQIGWWAKWSTYGHYAQHLDALKAFRQKHYSQ